MNVVTARFSDEGMVKVDALVVVGDIRERVGGRGLSRTRGVKTRSNTLPLIPVVNGIQELRGKTLKE